MPDQFITYDQCREHTLETNKKLDMIYRGLFIDNGKPCHQTRLDRHERVLNTICWVVGVASTIAIGGAVTFLYKTIIHVGM